MYGLSMGKSKYLLFFLLFCGIGIFSKDYFEHTLGNQSFIKHIEISYYNSNQKCGCISYAKVPLIPVYILHSFYIFPEYRNKGHGTKLLMYACKYVQLLGAQRIYIQPGPFEYDDKAISKNDSIYAIKTQRLVKLYAKEGFMSTHIITSLLAIMVYKITGINEDARHLMVKLV